MAHHPTSAARNATLGLAAAAMLAATSLASPTRADEPRKATAPTAQKIPAECATKPTEEAKLRCGIAYYDRKITDAKALGGAADARGAAADKRTAASRAAQECNENVTRDIQEASKAGPLKPDQVKAFESRIARCGRG